MRFDPSGADRLREPDLDNANVGIAIHANVRCAYGRIAHFFIIIKTSGGIHMREYATCSMCGKFCAVRSMNKALAGEHIDIL